MTVIGKRKMCQITNQNAAEKLQEFVLRETQHGGWISQMQRLWTKKVVKVEVISKRKKDLNTEFTSYKMYDKVIMSLGTFRFVIIFLQKQEFYV